MKQFDESLAMLGRRRLLEEYRAEIERAIKNVKRSDWDKWFRREWYRGTWRIGKMNERDARMRRDRGDADEQR